MTREKTLGILAVGFVLQSVAANAESRVDTGAARRAATHDARAQEPAEIGSWHVQGSLRSTLKTWAREKGWTGLGFLISLSALLKAGVSLRDALEMLERRSPPYTAERLRAVLARDDAYLGEALAESGYQWPDPRTIKLIRHFIVSDHPGDALAQLAETSTARLDASLKQLSTVISYAVQIAVFAVIFWFLEATNQMSDLVQSTTAS